MNFINYLLKDPAILVSSVNMLLRDEEFDSLESLCYAFSRDHKRYQEGITQEVEKLEKML